MARNLDWSKHNLHIKGENIAGKYAGKPSQSWDADWYAKNASKLKEPTEIKKQKQGIITFGKHKGKHLSQVPKDYLRWISQSITDKPILVKQAKKLLTSKSK